MKKFWLVFKYEYLKHVLQKRFIFGVLSIPFFIAVTIGLGLLSVIIGTDNRPIGIVDHAGVFSPPILIPDMNNGPLKNTEFIFYESSQEAQAILDLGEIQGFYTLAPDYLETGKVTLTALEPISSERSGDIYDFIRINLLKDKSTDLQMRLVDGPEFEFHSITDQRSAGETNFLTFLLPILMGVLFIISVNVSGGYLLQAVVEEKENRTMEIILTSVSTDQLMAGKIIGNLFVGLTQLLIWLVASAIGVLVFLRFQPQAGGLSVGPSFFWVMGLTFLPAFIMIAALMAMVGATVTETREAQQVSGPFSLLIVVPLWFTAAIMENPNSPLSIIFSLFPFTSPITMTMRAGFSTVPAWQLILSITLLFITAAGSLWLASRAFRLGMLRYGKKLSFRELLQKAS